MNRKKIASLICAFFVATTVLSGCSSGKKDGSVSGNDQSKNQTAVQNSSAQQTTSLPAQNPNDKKPTPRNETLYVNGLQWGPPNNFNYLSANGAWPVNPTSYNNGRELIYETLFMFNQLTGQMEPLLGEKYSWSDDYTLKVELNKNARWNDGKPLTSEDVVYTYQLGKKYTIAWSNYWTFIEDVAADGPNAFNIKLNKSNYNKLSVLDSIQQIPMHPKHAWEEIEKKAGNNIAEIRKEFNPNPVASGPYKVYYYDDTKITLVRDDNYWGKALFGKLPAPKYVTHIIYKDNAAGDLAFKNGEVDMSQQFIPQVWNMWKNGAPVRTYLKDAPYYISGSLPSIFFNLSKKGLDNADVRRAIAMSIDYKKISDLAMSGYSPNMEPSLTLLTDAESKYVDKEAIKPLQWKTDVAGANALLDKIGAAKGPDGIRVLNGTRLGPWELECPYGWSDWNATLEIVAQSAKQVGIELRTKFPEAPVVINDKQTGKFDILMDTPAGGQAPSQPWARTRFLMYSKGVAPFGEMAFWNWGRYKNQRADEIIEAIPSKTDLNELKALYTELTKIWLTDVPSVGLLYRPWSFYTVNESVWTGFPAEGDKTNIPPQICMDGAGIKALYNIKNK